MDPWPGVCYGRHMASMRRRPKGPTADQWNAEHPQGTRVRYRSHPGAEPRDTETISAAWMLGHGEAVVLLEGVSGGVALWALEVLPAAAEGQASA